MAVAGLATGETLDANKATTLVNSVTSLRMTEPLGKTEDAAGPGPAQCDGHDAGEERGSG